MKSLVLILILSLLLASITNAQDKSDRESTGLSAIVHTIRTETVQLWKGSSGEFIEISRYGLRTTTFDEQGRITKEEPAIPGCGYSDNLKRVRETDAEGREIQERSYLPNGKLVTRTTHTYDSYGNQTEVASYDHRNFLDFKWVRTYDANGRELEAVRYDRNGTHQGRFAHRDVNVYDDHGDKIDYMRYEPDGSLRWWSSNTYEHDSHGNWIKRIFYRRVVDGAARPYEPSEVTYRTITYY